MLGAFIVLALGLLLALVALLVELCRSRLTAAPSGGRGDWRHPRLKQGIDEPLLLTSCHLVSVNWNGNSLR
jgi:hypothetical protein